MDISNTETKMPGPRAPAFFTSALIAAAAMIGLPAAAGAQGQPPAALPGQAPPAARPVPSDMELARLIWATMITVDNANKSGNYSVLRDSSAQGFQIQNDPATLAQIFAGLRNNRVDLSPTLLVPPTYSAPAQYLEGDIIRAQGRFLLRPTAIGFDVLYQWEQGRWKLFGIDIQPLVME